MDLSVAEQVLDELLPSFEALETHNEAILQFLKDKGIATDEQLAPYMEQARSASTIRWRAVRLRMNRLLTPVFKAAEKTAEESPAESVQKRAEEAGPPKEPSSGKELKKESGKHPEKSGAGTKKDVAPSEEKTGSKENMPRERREEEEA
jgi:hypothetical protein